MNYSIKRHFGVILGIVMLLGFLTSGYILLKFSSYENHTQEMLSGGAKTGTLGLILEAKVNVMHEMVESSVGTQKNNDEFNKKVNELVEDFKQISKENSDVQLPKGFVQAVVLDKVADIFDLYKNIKASAFNLYRISWNYKWMTVAKISGLMIADLDGGIYLSGSKVAQSVQSKIAQIVTVVSSSLMPNDQKIILFGELNSLKAQIQKYVEACELSEKFKNQRLEQLKLVQTSIKRYNEKQGKTVFQSEKVVRSEFLKAGLALLFCLLACILLYIYATKSLFDRLQKISLHIIQQIDGWLTPNGSPIAHGFTLPERPEQEFLETYKILDEIIRKVNLLRREDVLVKRLLNVPYLLVNQKREAIFWNSALSILAKARSIEETGHCFYSEIIHFVDSQGIPIKIKDDPVEKCFTENHEVVQNIILKAGTDEYVVQAVCAPVFGADHKSEYVMVHLRDLREESRRTDAELDRQLECLRRALDDLKRQAVPSDIPGWTRAKTKECYDLIRAYAIAQQEESHLASGQMQTVLNRVNRETDLKKSVYKRMEQLQGEVKTVEEQFQILIQSLFGLVQRIANITQFGEVLQKGHTDVEARSKKLIVDISQAQSLVSASLQTLDGVHEKMHVVEQHQESIRRIIEQVSLMNANNTILGSRKDFSPADALVIADNLNQMMSMFLKSYRYIEGSTEEVKAAIKVLEQKLRSKLTICAHLVSKDQTLTGALQKVESIVRSASNEIQKTRQEVIDVQSLGNKLAYSFKKIEKRAEYLVQIGQASVDLQGQLEVGFKGVFEKIGSYPETSV